MKRILLRSPKSPFEVVAPLEVYRLPVVSAYLEALRTRLEAVRPALLGDDPEPVIRTG